MSEEEKEAIKDSKDILKELNKHKDKDFIGRLYYKNKPIEDILQILLDLIEKQQKEIEFYEIQELEYIQGYEDGKRHEQTAVAIKNENAQYELIQREIEKLEDKNKTLEDKNKTLEQLLQGNLYEMYKYYRELANSYQANCISKDKIRELKEKVENEMISNPYDFSYMINELLGE